jgi:hypothetical protein
MSLALSASRVMLRVGERNGSRQPFGFCRPKRLWVSMSWGLVGIPGPIKESTSEASPRPQ